MTRANLTAVLVALPVVALVAFGPEGSGVIVALIVAVWIAPIILGGEIMERKGRSRFAGHGLGFFFGWLGVVIVSCFADAPAR